MFLVCYCLISQKAEKSQ